jgi:hypothetical protein
VPILSKNGIRVSSLSDTPAIQDGVLEQFLMIAMENGNAHTKEFMRQRAGAIGGEWQIQSEPGRGTHLSVRVPKRAS